MIYEFIAIIIIMYLFWLFVLQPQKVIQVDMPLEKMSNVSIFDGF